VDWRLAKHPHVVATPHIGAQTVEAQERVGTDIAVQVRDFLKGGIIQHAVNFFSLSGDVYDQVKPAMDLAQRLGTFLAQACPGTPERIEVGLYGDLREIDSKPIQAAAVCGVMRCAFPENVTLVNARALASEKGIDVVESTSSAKVAFSNLMAIRLKTSEREFSVAGTLFGRNHLRLVDVDGVEVDAIPQGHLLLVRNDDTPGVVGHLGQALGQRNINIARMTVGRKPGSGRAVMLIEVDNEVPADALAEVTTIPGVREARALTLG
jgi:D-3-phosphoglycerate dehydrogenase